MLRTFIRKQLYMKGNYAFFFFFFSSAGLDLPNRDPDGKWKDVCSERQVKKAGDTILLGPKDLVLGLGSQNKHSKLYLCEECNRVREDSQMHNKAKRCFLLLLLFNFMLHAEKCWRDLIREGKQSSMLENQFSSYFSLSPFPHCNFTYLSIILYICVWMLWSWNCHHIWMFFSFSEAFWWMHTRNWGKQWQKIEISAPISFQIEQWP